MVYDILDKLVGSSACASSKQSPLKLNDPKHEPDEDESQARWSEPASIGSPNQSRAADFPNVSASVRTISLPNMQLATNVSAMEIQTKTVTDDESG